MLRKAAARTSDDASRMRLVHHGKRIVATRHLQKARQVENVAVHRKHAVGNGEATAMFAASAKLSVKVLHVAMAIDEHVRTRKPAAVDD